MITLVILVDWNYMYVQNIQPKCQRIKKEYIKLKKETNIFFLKMIFSSSLLSEND